MRFNIHVARDIFVFGAWVTGTAIVAWLYVWGDSLIVGAFMGAAELGLYRVGKQIVELTFLVIFAPVVPVFYSHISATISKSANNLYNYLNYAVVLLSLISLTLSFLLINASSLLERLILGQSWAGVSTVIASMALLNGFAYVVALNNEAYRASGHPKIPFVIMASALPIYFLAYYVLINITFEAFAWGRATLGVMMLAVHLWVMSKLYGINLKKSIIAIMVVNVIGISSIGVLKYFLLEKGGTIFYEILGAIAYSSWMVFIFVLLLFHFRFIKLVGTRVKLIKPYEFSLGLS